MSYKGVGNFNRELVSKLFKYLQPFKIGQYQRHLISPEIAKQLLSGNSFISTSSAITESELIKDTLFKVMLTSDKNNYPYINILDDEITINFNAIYQKDDNREKSILHIKSLKGVAT